MRSEVERHRSAHALFVAALALAPERRGEYVESACDDEIVRGMVVDLLDQDRRATERERRRIADATKAAEPEDALVGRQLGRYRAIRRIGAGGMGSVYEAEQEQPHRRVALKILDRARGSRDVRRRFELEAEVLGRLVHPHIAHVYEAGTIALDGGAAPFFAMELVEGAEPITTFADKNELDARERIALFLQVCDAVQHGHRKGVVHRDLKPHNILVDRHGHAKVIDFGVARTTDSDVALTTMHTHVGQLVGTLAYMSPEQCDADPGGIDTQSDVYSLGVVLYELLCGVSPYEIAGLSIPAATRVIREQAPVRPTARRRALRGDLEAILLKALEKRREPRFASVDALASDLRRHLDGLPILARPPSRWSLATAWMARHPVLATALACACLLGLTFASMWTGVELLAKEPARIAIDARGKAVLQSRIGVAIHEWPGGESGSVTVARLVQRPSELGGGRLALIGSPNSPRAGVAHGAVDAYDLEAPDELVWTTHSTPLVLPAGEPDRPEASFGLTAVVVADMIEGSAGDEVAVVQRLHPYSSTSIRVYDLAGRLRYEAWHDGTVNSAVWLAASRLLVVAGVEGQGMWSERGLELGERAPAYPAVVFALRVEDRGREESRWIVRDGRVEDSTVAWIRWLGPIESLVSLGELQLGLMVGSNRLPEGNHVTIEARFLQGTPAQLRPALYVVVDGDANELRRYSADWYRVAAANGSLPAESSFRWLDYAELPPPLRADDAQREPSSPPR